MATEGKKLNPWNHQGAVSEFNEARRVNHVPPLVAIPKEVAVGHGDAQDWLAKNPGYPAHGWMTGLKRNGTKLVTNFRGVPDVLKEAFDRGAYSKLSAEVYQDFVVGEKHYGPVIKRVVMLGADVPAVKSLADINGWYRGKDGWRVNDVEIFDAGNYGPKGVYAESELDKVVENFKQLKMSDITMQMISVFADFSGSTQTLSEFLESAHEQAINFEGAAWTAYSASEWLKENNRGEFKFSDSGGRVTAELTPRDETQWRYNQKTIDAKLGITAIVAFPKGVSFADESNSTDDIRSNTIAAIKSTIAELLLSVEKISSFRTVKQLSSNDTHYYSEGDRRMKDKLLASLKAKNFDMTGLDAMTETQLELLDSAIPATTVDTFSDTEKKLAAKFAELDSKFEARKTEIEAKEKALDEKMAARDASEKKLGVSKFLEEQVVAKKLLPAEVDGQAQLLMAAPTSDAHKFGEGDTAVSLSTFDLAKKAISDRPAMFGDAHRAPAGKKNIAGDEARVRATYKSDAQGLADAFTEDEFVSVWKKSGETADQFLMIESN